MPDISNVLTENISWNQNFEGFYIFSEPREYCEAEEFRASCNSDEVVVMHSASYGRMTLGRCVIRCVLYYVHLFTHQHIWSADILAVKSKNLY